MKSSASESKPFQSRSKGEISGRTRRKERLSLVKLKQAFSIDSKAKLFMYLIQGKGWRMVNARLRDGETSVFLCEPETF